MTACRSKRQTSSSGLTRAISAWRSKKLKQRSIRPRPTWRQSSPAANWKNRRSLVAEAALRSAEAQAKNSDTTLMRATILAKDRFGTQAALDDAQAAEVKAHSEVDQATANLAYENQQLVVIDANIGVAKAKVGSAEAALLTAKFALADTAVWAPIDGIVANRKTQVGEYVAAGTRMLSIVPIENLWVEANYRETQVGGMKVGDPVRVGVDTYPGQADLRLCRSDLPARGLSLR
jgi:Multidrug resistance efflux pump